MTKQPDLFLSMLLGEADPPPAVQLTSRTQARRLQYYRCRTCTEIVTLPGELDEERATCDCEGKGFDYLGESKGATLSRFETRAACDARCTNATGPNCDCLCGAENHGTGKTVRVEIVQGVPRVRLRDPRQARERRSEYEQELNSARNRLASRYGQALADYQARRWLSSFQVKRSIESDLEAIAAAQALKVHRNRITALRKI